MTIDENSDSWLNALVNKLPPLRLVATSIITITTMVAASIGIFSSLRQEKAGVAFEITNVADVLDLRKPLKDLKIFFQGEDIGEGNLNLRIFTVRLANVGPSDISQNLFDQDLIWGIEIKDGKVIEARLTDSNSDYLLENIKPTILRDSLGNSRGDTIVEFNKTILERNKYFTLEILVLHKKESYPEIISLGKIMGIDKIEPVMVLHDTGAQPFWRRTFAGTILIQGARVLAYTIVGFLLVFSIVTSTTKMRSFLHRRKRNLLANKIEQILDPLDIRRRTALMEALSSMDMPTFLLRYYIDEIMVLLNNENASFSELELTIDLERGPTADLGRALGIGQHIRKSADGKIEIDEDYLLRLSRLKKYLHSIDINI